MWETCGSARRVARVSARPRGHLQFITDRVNNGNEARTMESICSLSFRYGMTVRPSYHSCDVKAGARSSLPVNGTGPGTCNQALGTFLSRCPKHSIARHPSFPTISPSADTSPSNSLLAHILAAPPLLFSLFHTSLLTNTPCRTTLTTSTSP